MEVELSREKLSLKVMDKTISMLVKRMEFLIKHSDIPNKTKYLEQMKIDSSIVMMSIINDENIEDKFIKQTANSFKVFVSSIINNIDFIDSRLSEEDLGFYYFIDLQINFGKKHYPDYVFKSNKDNFDNYFKFHERKGE